MKIGALKKDCGKINVLRVYFIQPFIDDMINYVKPRRCWKHRGGFSCAPGGARFLRVKVPNPPGSGKDIAEGKGVAGDCKSEGSWMWGTY